MKNLLLIAAFFIAYSASMMAHDCLNCTPYTGSTTYKVNVINVPPVITPFVPGQSGITAGVLALSVKAGQVETFEEDPIQFLFEGTKDANVLCTFSEASITQSGVKLTGDWREADDATVIHSPISKWTDGDGKFYIQFFVTELDASAHTVITTPGGDVINFSIGVTMVYL